MLRTQNLVWMAISGAKVRGNQLEQCNNTKLVQRSFGNLSELRRERIRANIKVSGSEDPTLITFPRESLGNDYELNWQLNRHEVTPLKEAYRNLHTRGLLQLAKGSVDKNKAFQAASTTNGEATLEIVGEGVSDRNYNLITKEVRRYLGNTDIFVRDGAIGSHRWAEVPTRIIGDNASTDLFLSNMLPRVPLRDPFKQPVELVVYYASGLQVKPEKFGIASPNFALYNPSNKSLLVGGSFSAESFREVLVQAAGHSVMTRGDTLPISADSYVSENGKTVLVFSSNGTFLKSKVPGQLFGAHNHFWNSNGLVRAWNGVSYPAGATGVTPSLGSYIETETTTVSLKSPNASTHPDSVVFLVSDNKGALPTLSKLSPTQAAQHYLAGYNGSSFQPFFSRSMWPISADVSQGIALFKKLVQDNSVGVYMINTGSKSKELKAEELQKLFTAITDGSAASAPTASGFKTFTPISSLPGFKTLDTRTDAATLDKDLSSFIDSKFPTVKFE